MPYFRINYEEYMHFDEFIEAVDKDEAEKKFKDNIQEFEPTEAEQYEFSVEELTTEEMKTAK